MKQQWLFGLAALLFCGWTASVFADENIAWTRLRPLDSNPLLDSGTALARPCVPGETLVLREDNGRDTQQRLALHAGQFVICIANLEDGNLEVADGPGNVWVLTQRQVNATRGFPENWLAYDRDYLVWAYNRDTVIFRESLANSFEGNFFYLLLDRDDQGEVAAAILIDSGTGYADLRPYIEPVVGNKPLLVISTHSHWDHFGGHRHLLNLANVTLLGYQPQQVYNPYPQAPEYDLAGLRDYFDLKDWPASPRDFMVGNRRFAILPIPGHTGDSVALYDYREQLLFTGDTVCPCYLFIEDWENFAASLKRLAAFAADHPVRWLLGGHVEMSVKHAWNNRHEYFYFGTNTHWREHPLQMTPGAIELARKVVNTALKQAGGDTPRYDARHIDHQFHSVPLVAIPFPGIPAYFRIDSERLVETLRKRHNKHDQRRLQ